MPKVSEDVRAARDNIDLDELAAGNLGETVASLGKAGVDYSESSTVANAKKDTTKIKTAKKILVAFFGACGARHLTKQQLVSFLEKVKTSHPEKLSKLKEQHVAEWTENMACRYRNLLAHVNEIARYPSVGKALPPWFDGMNLPGMKYDAQKLAGTDEDHEDDNDEDDNDTVTRKPAAKSSACAKADEFVYTWNTELNLPQRHRLGPKQGDAQFGLFPEIPKGADDNEEITVQFLGSPAVTVPGKTWGELRNLRQHRQASDEGFQPHRPLRVWALREVRNPCGSQGPSNVFFRAL